MLAEIVSVNVEYTQCDLYSKMSKTQVFVNITLMPAVKYCNRDLCKLFDTMWA